jgi:hypothetical protein
MIIDALKPIADIINKFIPDGAEKNRLAAEIEKASLELDKERIGALGKMLGSQSFFVSGAIPSILWVLVISIFNNYILMPWAHIFGKTVPDVSMPSEVWTLAGWIITGLLAKKAVDGNAFYSKDGTLIKPSRSEAPLNAISPLKSDEGLKVMTESYILPDDTIEVEPDHEYEVDKNPDYYDKRYEELIDKYGIK